MVHVSYPHVCNCVRVCEVSKLYIFFFTAVLLEVSVFVEPLCRQWVDAVLTKCETVAYCGSEISDRRRGERESSGGRGGGGRRGGGEEGAVTQHHLLVVKLTVSHSH